MPVDEDGVGKVSTDDLLQKYDGSDHPVMAVDTPALYVESTELPA
jgi:hypothetical protein